MAAAEGTVPTRDLRLDLGPAHPSSAGGLRLRVSLDGDRVATADPVVGHLHRGVEKLFEVRDYRQAIVLANRHDWLSAFSSELGVALAVERLLGLEVPLRATWGRTLLAELNRLLSHLAFLGAVPAALSPALAGPDGELARTAYAARERVQSLMEEVSGGRMHFMFNRVGGLRDDLPVGWLDQVAEALPGLGADVARIRSLLDDDDALGAATTGVGVLPVALAEAYGVSGPVARASGLDLDLRRDEPYLAYGELAEQGVLRVPVRHEGDARARFGVLAEQAAVSVDLAAACVERLSALGPGPVDVRLPKILRPPEGSAYACTENPLGLNGYYLVSRGEPTPWRLKLRTASFNNVAVLGDLLPGCRVQDLVAVLASMFFVVGDLDK